MIYAFDGGDSPYNGVPQILESINHTEDDYDREENYLIEISLDSSAPSLPEGYSIKFSDLQLQFTYEQVE